MTIDLHTRLWTSIEQFGPTVAEQMRRRRALEPSDEGHSGLYL